MLALILLITFRSSVFSISDGLSVSLLNISREGLTLGRGRLVAPSASLGEVNIHISFSIGKDVRMYPGGSGVAGWEAEVKGWKVADT